jgi:DNA-binding MarR family transcriptional regulator/GNAT superfamily N-acetyltransferase
MRVAGQAVSAVRRFNRFYTRHIGALDAGFLESAFSLTEARVLYEMAHQRRLTATSLRTSLAIDAGYLSRILRTFRQNGLVAARPSDADGRTTELSLTPKGRRQFAVLDRRQHQHVERMLEGLSQQQRRTLQSRMEDVAQLLAPGTPSRKAAGVTLRAHRPGDIGWITHRQAVLYHQEYGWDERYEALIARIMAEFVEKYDPRTERCWIAEREGEIIGSIFCVRKTTTVAKLRLLYVEPSARGLGVGTRLVDACITFARARGYRTLTLWTNSVLEDARRIYERKGFRLASEEPHQSFGNSLVGQTWNLAL